MFVKGKSGNPSGRPKKTGEELEFFQACRQSTKEAFEMILALMRGAEKESTRFQAAQFLIERAWGKAVDRVEVSGPEGDPVETHGELVIKVITAQPK